MVLDFFLSILFPPVCVGCRRIGRQICIGCKSDLIPATQMICPGCQNVLSQEKEHNVCSSPTKLDSIVSLYVYKGLAKKLLKQTKYQFISSALKELLQGELLLRALKIDRKSIIVPIPLHPNRLKWRGFNQSEIIGSLLASHLQIPQHKLLVRIKETRPQAQLHTRKEREKNIIGAFVLREKLKNIPRSVILVDDVFTSGFTMGEAAAVLKNAGVKFVHGFTLMQGER